MLAMGKNPWEQDDPDVQAFAGMRPQRRFPWKRVLLGAGVVALVTFVLGFYVPLIRAHEDLVRKFVNLGEKAHALGESAQKLDTELKRVTENRDELLTEKQTDEAEVKKQAVAADALKDKLSASMTNYLKGDRGAVSTDGGEVLVAFADGTMFVTGQATVSRLGRGALCELAKQAEGVTFEVAGVWSKNERIPPLLARNYDDAWAVSAALSASAVQTLKKNCSVAESRLKAVGLGEAVDKSTMLGVPPPGLLIRLTLPDKT